MLEFRCLKCFSANCGHFRAHPSVKPIQVDCATCNRRLVAGGQALKNFVSPGAVQQVHSSPTPVEPSLKQAVAVAGALVAGAGASQAPKPIIPDSPTGWMTITTPKVSVCCGTPWVVYRPGDGSIGSPEYAWYDDFLRLEGFDASGCCANHGSSTRTWKGRFNDCLRCNGTGGIHCQLRGNFANVVPGWFNTWLTGHTCTEKCHSLCLDCQGSGSSRVYEDTVCSHSNEIVRFTEAERDLLGFHVRL